MAKPAKVIILGDASDAAKAFKQIRDEAGKSESKLQQVGQGLSSAGKTLTLGLTAPLVAAGVAATQAAEGLSESINAVNKTFESAAGTIHDFGETAAETVGLSQRAFNELATPLGAMLRNAGLDAEFAAEKTIDLTQRAADMASVFNVDVSEALGAIQAGLRGEADPLERFGVNMKVSSVQAHALATGIADSVAEMGPQEEALARVSLLMEQTDRIAGDFNETSGETANKTRIQKARMEDLAAEIGEHLIPVKAQLLDMVSNLLTAFSDLSPETQGLVVKLGGLAAALGPVLFVVGKTITAIKTLRTTMAGAGTFIAGPWGIAIAGAIAVLGALAKEHMDSKARVEEWREAIRGGVDDIKTHTDEILTSQFTNEQWAEALAEAGLTIRDVRAALEDEAEAERVSNALRQVSERVWRDRNQQVVIWIDEQRDAITEANRLEEAEKNLNDELKDQRSTFEGLIAGGIQPYMQATDDAAGSTDDLAGATKGLADEQRALVDPLFNLRTRTLALVEAQDDYNAALVEHGPKSREAEDAAVALAEAQLEANAAAERYASEGGPESLAAVEDLLREGGLLEEQIAAIIERILELNRTPVTPKDFPRQGNGSGGGEQVFHAGGRVPGSSPRTILAHGGETVLATHKMSPLEAFADQFGGISVNGSGADIHFHNHGTLVGINDVESWLIEALTRARRRGVDV